MKNICLFLLLQFLFFEGMKAQSKIDSMLTIVELKQMDSAYFKTLFTLGVDHERKDRQKAMAFFGQNIKDANPQNLSVWTGLSMIRLAGVFSSTGEKDSAMHYFNMAKAYVEEHPEELRARHQYFTGLGIHQNRYEQYYEALASYLEVEKVDIDVLGKMNLAGNYLNKSNVYRKLGMVEEDLESIFKSLEIFEEIQQLMGLSFCYNSLAVLYTNKKEYDKAEEYLLKSYDLRIQQQDKSGEAVVLGNLGVLMKDTERYEEAKQAFRNASAINEEFGLKNLWSNMQLNLGVVYLKLNQPDSALYYLEIAHDLLLKHDASANTAQILIEKGKAYRSKGNLKMAEKHFKEALRQASGKNDPKSRRYVYGELTDLYELKRDFGSALSYNRLFHQINDSLESIDLKIKFQGLEAKYAFDKKETEINLLKTEKELAQIEMEKQYARQFAILLILILVVIIAFLLVNRYRLLNRAKRLLEIEKMRLGIAQDLHDDIGSTLSSIQIMSKVARQQELNQKEIFLGKIEHQASMMMDKLGDIVWSLKAASNSMEDLVAKMKEFASELLEPLDIEVEFEGMELLLEQNMDLEKRKNLYLIFKEALNNAAKYSQCTQIRVSFRPNGQPGTFQLKITDNGKGFDLQQATKGNGLTHIKERAEKIKGTLRINSEAAKGTQVVLDLASHD